MNRLPLLYLLVAFVWCSGPSGNFADMAGAFEKDVLHVKLPQSALAKLKSRYLAAPIASIKTYPASSFYINDDYVVRLTENFYKTHVEGIPPESYQKPTLVGRFGQVLIEKPRDLENWKYGNSGELRTTNYVKMTELNRLSKGGRTDGTEMENQMVFTATRYKGRKLENGKRGNDIFVIEGIKDFYHKPAPVFRKGDLSGVTIVGHSETYGMSETWNCPTVVVNRLNIEIRGTKEFINNHVLGNTGPGYSQHYLFVFPAVDLVELRDSDVSAIAVGKEGTVRTATSVSKFYKHHGINGWQLVNLNDPLFVYFKAKKYDYYEKKDLVLVLTGFSHYQDK